MLAAVEQKTKPFLLLRDRKWAVETAASTCFVEAGEQSRQLFPSLSSSDSQVVTSRGHADTAPKRAQRPTTDAEDLSGIDSPLSHWIGVASCPLEHPAVGQCGQCYPGREGDVETTSVLLRNKVVTISFLIHPVVTVNHRFDRESRVPYHDHGRASRSPQSHPSTVSPLALLCTHCPSLS
jgi:hypothetical protein